MPSKQSQPDVVACRLTCRNLPLRSESFDADGRSFEAVVSSEAPALVYDYRLGGYIDEVLVADGGEFPDSMPLLDDHQRHLGINSVLGSAVDFRREGDVWMGRCVVGRSLDGSPRREQALADIQDGHLRAVSIGYQVMAHEEIQPGQTGAVAGKSYTAGGRRLRVSTRWRAHELSLTPIGADSEALIRSMGEPPEPQERSYFAR